MKHSPTEVLKSKIFTKFKILKHKTTIKDAIYGKHPKQNIGTQCTKEYNSNSVCRTEYQIKYAYI